jgi:hypothetical protein
MKMREFLSRLDTPFDDNFQDDGLAQEITGQPCWINLADYGFSSRPIASWLCTDTLVGIHAIYYQGEPVAISTQLGRKMCITYEWVSMALFEKVQSVVAELVRKENGPKIDLLDLEKDVGDLSFQVGFSGQLMAKRVIYKGEEVDVVKTFHGYKPDEWKKVIVKVGGRDVSVDISEIHIPIPVKATEAEHLSDVPAADGEDPTAVLRAF